VQAKTVRKEGMKEKGKGEGERGPVKCGG